MFRNLVATLLATLSIAAFAGVDVNRAAQADLEAVPGMGPALTSRVLEERKKAPFKDWADLIQRVRGIGEGNAAKLSKGGLTVGDAGYPPAAKPATK
jgi:competence protein ComEA